MEGGIQLGSEQSIELLQYFATLNAIHYLNTAGVRRKLVAYLTSNIDKYLGYCTISLIKGR